MTSAHWAFDTRIFHKISKSLVRHGYEVILVAPHPRDETVEGVRIISVPKSGSRLRRMTVSLYDIYRKTAEVDGDLYHFHDPELIPVGLLLRLRGKHVVYDAHEDLPRTVSYKDYVPRALRGLVAEIADRLELGAASRLTAVIGATPPIAQRFRDVNMNTVVVHNFPILDELNGKWRRWDRRDPVVAYVGAISRERGLFELLEAFKELRKTFDCRLALAGWFSPPQLKDEIQKMPISSHVDCLGLLSRTQIADLLARVRVGLVALHPEPNFLNSKPTKLFEYMSAGIPVVASDFPLWREIVQKAKCGLLVDPLNPVSIAAASAHLLTHPREAAAMGRCGRAAAEKMFNWRSEERTLIDLYRSILHGQEVSAAEQLECL